MDSHVLQPVLLMELPWGILVAVSTTAKASWPTRDFASVLIMIILNLSVLWSIANSLVTPAGGLVLSLTIGHMNLESVSKEKLCSGSDRNWRVPMGSLIWRSL